MLFELGRGRALEVRNRRDARQTVGLRMLSIS